MAPPRAARCNAAATKRIAGYAALFVAAWHASSCSSAFVRGNPASLRGADASRIQGRAISEADRAAVLRLPSSLPESDGREQQEERGEHVGPLASGGASEIEISSSQRAALRMQSAEDQADFMKKMSDKEYMEEAIRQERSFWDGSAMGPLWMSFYYLAVATVMWTWIMNLYRVWELGHPAGPTPPPF